MKNFYELSKLAYIVNASNLVRSITKNFEIASGAKIKLDRVDIGINKDTVYVYIESKTICDNSWKTLLSYNRYLIVPLERILKMKVVIKVSID